MKKITYSINNNSRVSMSSAFGTNPSITRQYHFIFPDVQGVQIIETTDETFGNLMEIWIKAGYTIEKHN